MGIKGDLVLIQRAVANRWLTDDLKPMVIRALETALDSGDTRAELRAAQIVATIESQNQKDELSELKELHERIVGIANRFGIVIPDAGDIESTAVPAIGSNQGDRATFEEKRAR